MLGDRRPGNEASIVSVIIVGKRETVSSPQVTSST